MNAFIAIIFGLSVTSCSLFGVQSEEGPRYEVLKKNGDFEIRRYESYVVATTTVRGKKDNASEVAFKRLAGYIYGHNKDDKKLSMTSPVKIEQSTELPMTTPVKVSTKDNIYIMSFFMPSEYKINELPTPLDQKVKLKKIESKTVASHQYTWFSSDKRNESKAKELRQWLKTQGQYKAKDSYTYAGYNPPWTIPFLRRNEVHIEVNEAD